MMKTVRGFLTTWLAAVFLLTVPVTAALAGKPNATGMIERISSDYRGLTIKGTYYQLDRRTVVHAPVGDRYLSVDKLTAGTQIGFRIQRAGKGSVVPRIAEIWIYLD